MPSTLAEFVKSIAGQDCGPRYLHSTFGASTASTVASTGAISPVHAYIAWDDTATAATLHLHPAAIWTSYTVHIAPGAGLHGRVVTLHTGWGHDGEAAPTTLAQFARLADYRVQTYGGADVPTEAARTHNCPFSDGRSDVLKMRSFPIGGRVKFYYFFTEKNAVSTPIDASRFDVVVSGVFTVYGLN